MSEPSDRCPACGVRGLDMEHLGGACHALECPDPTAWLRSKAAGRAWPPAGPSEAVPEISRLKAENASLLESLRAAEAKAELWARREGALVERGIRADTEQLSELQSMTTDRDLWRKALCEVLELVPQHYEEFEQVCIGQSPGGDPARGEHPKGEWVAWDAEYPEDGSISLNVMASPPHIAQVKADEELSTALAAAEQRAEAAEKAHRLCTGKLIAAAGRIANAEEDADTAVRRLSEASAMADRAHAIAQALPGWTADSHVERLNLELQALTAALRSWASAALHDEER